MLDIFVSMFGWTILVAAGGYSCYKFVGWGFNKLLYRAFGLDFDTYVYIPYEEKGQSKSIKVRYPKTAVEWLVVAGFVGAICGILYKLSQNASSRKRQESKRAMVAVYKRYTKLGLFTMLFPFACGNEANDVVEFCKHVANYYRTVTSVVDLLGDVAGVTDDVFNFLWSDEESDKPSDSKMEKAIIKGCIHASDCPAHAESSSDIPCHNFCGGHHCVHFSSCDPEHHEEKKMQGGKSSKLYTLDDMNADLLDIDRTHSAGDLDTHGLHLDTSYKLDDVESDSDDDGVGITIHAQPADSTTNRVKKFLESQVKFNEIIQDQENARVRLENGESRCGIGYIPPHRSRKNVSSVWQSIKTRFLLSTGWVPLLLIAIHIQFCKLTSYSKNLFIRYKWWFLGGATIFTAAASCYGIFRYVTKECVAAVVPEGGKKKNRAGKKARFDLKGARDAISTSKAPTHTPSKWSDADIDLNWRQKQADREEEERQAYMDHLEREERMADYDYNPENFTDSSLKNMSRVDLLKHIKEIRKTWFDKDQVDKIKTRRDTLKRLFLVLHERFPKKTTKQVWKKTEQLRPGHIPSYVPIQYCILTEYENGEDGYVNGFAYNDCLFVPRHGVAGGKKSYVVIGAKKIELPSKCVVMKDGTDEVMYPLPAGLSQNKGLKFRLPVPGEIATLFWFRPKNPRIVQQSGIVGAQNFLGKDKSLMTFKFDGSTEDGSCGGLYISARDGYAIGVHGLGGVHVTTTPEFYPFKASWAEELISAKQRTPSYVTSSDSKYYDDMDAIINNNAALSSLNL